MAALYVASTAGGCTAPRAASQEAKNAAPRTPSSPLSAESHAAEAPNSPNASWQFRVAFAEGKLDVEAAFDRVPGGVLTSDDSSARYFEDVEFARDDKWAKLERKADDWSMPCREHCSVRYRFELERAARALADGETALAAGDAFVAPPSTWLLRPRSTDGAARLELRVDPGANGRFASAFELQPGAAEGTYSAPVSALGDAGFAAFGHFELVQVPAGDTTVQLAIAPHDLGLSVAEARDWISASAGALASFYRGHLPARRVLIVLVKGSGRNTRGETLSGGGPAVLVQTSDLVNPKTTHDDWVVTHELIHANFPDVGRQHTWFSEGLATYLEPVARARVGLVSDTRFWSDLVEGLPQGLPGPGDGGLEHTKTWGRTYWGGALFFLTADLRLREETGNQRSLDDILLAIGKTGASGADFWDIQKVLETGDRATGTAVLHNLYDEFAKRPGSVDLPALFLRLGVRARGKAVTFDDTAPLAAVRRAITAQASR